MIDTFFNVLRSVMLVTVISIFAFTLVYVPHPSTDGGYNNVEVTYAAGGGPWDQPNFLANLGSRLLQARDFVLNSWLHFKEQVLDVLAWNLAKNTISNMTADIVDWINGGMPDGGPAFVQDLDNWLLKQGDEAVGRFINELGGAGSFICEPFRLDVQLAVATYYDQLREDRSVVECTLTDIIDNFEDFIGGDVQAGGWNGWFDLMANPSQTPYGSILSARTEASARLLNAEGEEIKLLDFGSGFFSYRECTEVDGDAGPIEQCNIVTPGEAFGGALAKAMGLGPDTLVAADEFNEIISALIGQLTQRAIDGARGGLLGLSGADGYTPYSRPTSFTQDIRDEIVAGDDEAFVDSDVIDGGLDTDVVDRGVPAEKTTLEIMNERLAEQEAVADDIDFYIAELRDFIANPLNDEDDVFAAEIALDQAENMRDRVADVIATGNALRDDYSDLEDEFGEPATSPERRNEIGNEQTDLLEDFYRLSFLPAAELDIVAAEFDDILARNVEPVRGGRPGIPIDGGLLD